MSLDKDTVKRDYENQLLDFESQLRHTMDDESLLQDVFAAIRGLLKEKRGSESDIRKILHDRFEAGKLRQDTFQVVERMLDRVLSDFVSTLPGDNADNKDFGDTDVIDPQSLDSNTAEELLQVGSVLRDRFLLQQQVSGGSMGMVYKALDRRLAEVEDANPWVAIKVLTPKLSRNANALRAMQQEAAKGRCLAHPNIVRFIDLDRDDDLYFIVMEWIEGRSLAAVLDDPTTDPIDLKTALEIVKQVGRALDYAHRCGVVHADVKPGNLMIMPDGNVKLIDFGVARIRQQQVSQPSKFDPAILGAATPAYSSMQVLTGEEPVPADDVFSLGCLMYRLVAGYRVFGPRNAAEAAEEGMAPQRPQGLSDRQWRALKRSLALSRVARYASPKEFLNDLLERGRESTAPNEEFEETVVNSIEAENTRRWPRAVALMTIAGGLAYLGTQTDTLDEYIGRLPILTASSPPTANEATNTTEEVSSDVSAGVDEARTDPAPTSQAASAAEEIADPGLGTSDSIVNDTARAAPILETEVFADDTLPDVTLPVQELPTLVEDLPEPTHTVLLGDRSDEVAVILREDGDAAVIDVVRSTAIAVPLSVRLEEVGFSGNRSPWEAGQYTIANDGVLEFAAGQDRAQVTLSMMSDPLREADRQVDLVFREADAPDRDLGRLRVVLEDDDQREFEARLAPNTVAFAVSQVSVRESDPAVQIDVLRFNPDSQRISVDYVVQDVTASEGADYFAPNSSTVLFAPGQRSARILIPLVQDSEDEPDEAFFLEFADVPAQDNIFDRIAVMIRDDDA